MPAAISAPMSLERDALNYRNEQMEEMGTRKATIAEARAAGEDAMGQLRAVLATHWTRVVDLLREWDEDGNGVVSRKEFLRALPVLGIKVNKAEGEELFATFDSDGSGEVTLKELNRKLRIGATIELDSRLQDGAAGEIVLESKNKVALRDGLQEGVSSLVGVSLDASSDVPIIEQLAQALSNNYVRVIDVFREWDDDGSGTVSKREFRQALPLLGLKDVSRAEADELFDSLDRDHSGELAYAELSAKLRKRVDPEEVARIRREKEKAQKAERDARRAEREAAVLERGGTRKAAKQEALRELRRREVEVMGALVQVQRELRRAQSESAIAEARARKRQAAQEVKSDLDRINGRDITRKLKECEAATADEIVEISEQLNGKLAKLAGSLPDGKNATGPLWYALFKHMDQDGSGMIAYGELREGLRQQLRLGKTDLPEARLRSLWKALDVDASGWISCGEFGKFMRKGEGKGQKAKVREARARVQQKVKEKEAAARAEHEARVGRDLAAKFADVPTADAAEVDMLATFLNSKLAQVPWLLRDGWFKFFKLMDNDASGRIQYAELVAGLRDQLSVTASELPEAQLQALWKALDDDKSGWISAGEFLRFVRRGHEALPEHEASNWTLTQAATRQRVSDDEEEWAQNAMRRALEMQDEIERETARIAATLRKSASGAAKKPKGSSPKASTTLISGRRPRGPAGIAGPKKSSAGPGASHAPSRWQLLTATRCPRPVAPHVLAPPHTLLPPTHHPCLPVTGPALPCLFFCDTQTREMRELPPIHPQAAGAAFAARTSRFEY